MINPDRLLQNLHQLRCFGGISHDFAEDSREDDIVLGCEVLADAARSLLEHQPPDQ